MRVMFAFLALTAVPTAASATPVMLNCVVNASDPVTMSVQLNEDAGTVTYTFPDNGRTYRMAAFFAPDRVSFNSFSIDRKSLAIQRHNNGQFDQSVFKLPPVDTGKCVLDTQKRAF